MEELRLCCGVKPVILKVAFPRVIYKATRIQCPKCGRSTATKKFDVDAVRAWNEQQVYLSKEE